MRMVCLFRVHHRKFRHKYQKWWFGKLPRQSCWGRMLWGNEPWSCVDGLQKATPLEYGHFQDPSKISTVYPDCFRDLSKSYHLSSTYVCLRVIFSFYHGIHHHKNHLFLGRNIWGHWLPFASRRLENPWEEGQWFASSPYTARHWALEGILESTRIVGPNAFESRKKTQNPTKRYYMYICINPRHPKSQKKTGKEVFGTPPQKDTICIPSWEGSHIPSQPPPTWIDDSPNFPTPPP